MANMLPSLPNQLQLAHWDPCFPRPCHADAGNAQTISGPSQARGLIGMKVAAMQQQEAVSVGHHALFCSNCTIAIPCNVSACRLLKLILHLLINIPDRTTIAVDPGAVCAPPPPHNPTLPPTHHALCILCLAVLGFHHPLQEHEGLRLQPQDGLPQPPTLPPLREGELSPSIGS
jgi:hypothetical protein